MKVIILSLIFSPSHDSRTLEIVLSAPHVVGLCSWLHFTLTDDYDIMKLVQAGNAAMTAMAKLFQNKNIDVCDKRKFYQSIPLNLLLWGCETWALKDSLVAKLRTFHLKCIRRILDINNYDMESYRITRKNCLERIWLTDMDKMIADRQLRWLGKCVRMDDSRLLHKFLNAWVPSRSRKTGGQHRTIKSTTVGALKKILPPFTKTWHGQLKDWYHLAKDLTDWD